MKENRIEFSAPENANFISVWSALPPELCEDLIEFHKTHSNLHRAGAIGTGAIDERHKKSTDVTIEPVDLEKPGYEPFNDYLAALHECYRDYCDQWPFLKSYLTRTLVGAFNFQKYEVGGHFSRIHSERMEYSVLNRILVWMTYLNDVEEGGETEFPHFGLKIKPKAGKTIIWPAEWTHAHRGCPTISGQKYILTGWFLQPPDI